MLFPHGIYYGRVRPEDVGALGYAIDRLLSQGELRQGLGAAAARTMERFDRERILPQFGALFAEVARKRRIPVREDVEDFGFADRPVPVGAGEVG